MYVWANLKKDVVSGLIVGVIAIPLGMGFAIASGVKPEFGIYTTIVAGILISLFGGSRFQIGGPTGAFIPVVLSILLAYGYDKLLVAGFLAGVMLLLMGFCKVGSLVAYMPRPVTIGFTTGIAVLIFSGQIANFLGLRNLAKHDAFLENMKEIAVHLNTTNLYSVLTAVICLMFLLLTPKVFPKVPGPLVAIILSTFVATLFYPGKVSTIGSSFGAIPNGFPALHLPAVAWHEVPSLLQPALIIALLGGIESLLSAVVADGMTGQKHDSNRELIGQGIANMIVPLFGGIPATGAIARTATNIKSGATSRMSGVIHGIVVLVTLLLFAPYAAKIPLASIAPVLMLVAWNMSERQEFLHVLRSKTGDSIILLATFLCTVFTTLSVAVGVGLVLAVLFFTKKMSAQHQVFQVVPDRMSPAESLTPHVETNAATCPKISMFTIEGPLFFGAAQRFERSVLTTIHQRPSMLLLRMGDVPFLDLTGVSYLKNIVLDMKKQDGFVLICEMNQTAKDFLRKAGLYDIIGDEHFFDRTGEAIAYALAHIHLSDCAECKRVAFEECAARRG